MLETGIDIIDVSRVARSIGNPAFLEKYFHPVEIAYCGEGAHSAQHFAVRFAAKEAVRKVLLSHVDTLSWRDSWIENDESGKPHLVFSEKLLSRIRIRAASVSLSHTKDTAAAIVLIDLEAPESKS